MTDYTTLLDKLDRLATYEGDGLARECAEVIRARVVPSNNTGQQLIDKDRADNKADEWGGDVMKLCARYERTILALAAERDSAYERGINDALSLINEEQLKSVTSGAHPNSLVSKIVDTIRALKSARGE